MMAKISRAVHSVCFATTTTLQSRQQKDNKSVEVGVYPSIEPYQMEMISVSTIHSLYLEQSGTPVGTPVVFLHGGPGSGTFAHHRRYFNPDRYRIILFDQRGAGRSQPLGCLTDNTTLDLVADMETIRQHLSVDRWVLFGGSWGSTLAIAYAQAHPERVLALVLRGVFLMRSRELHWFYQSGANALFPEAWADFAQHIPVPQRHDLVAAYYDRLTSEDPVARRAAANAWWRWEASTSHLRVGAFQGSPRLGDRSRAFAKIECHYVRHQGFLSHDLLDNIAKIHHLPAAIVQGRYDVVCPPKTAWEVHRAWPRSRLFLAPTAGHSASEPEIAQALVAATEAWATDCHFDRWPPQNNAEGQCGS
ncbi:MAG: prolyl aminopeptidase [Cyanobacteria bacterium P01_F01_bin.33]